MNDYTKNISSSVFTPGAVLIDKKLLKKFNRGDRNQDAKSTLSGVSSSMSFKTGDLKGMQANVTGPLGEKKVKITRCSTAKGPRPWRMSTFDESTEKMKVYYPEF